ncbi:hypothetical protein LSAT2_010616, partial [Lamellibrachia satsuma]
MDNMKPLIDAVLEDRREETATNDDTGRPNYRGAREGGQRGSSCGRRGRSGQQNRGGMTSHMRQLGGPPFMHGPSPAGPYECGYGRRMPLMRRLPGYRQRKCPWGRQLSPMNCPPEFGPTTCQCGRGPRFMHGPSAFGPFVCPFDACPPCSENMHIVSDEEHVGKDNEINVDKHLHDTQEQHDVARMTSQQEPGQHRARCPCGDRLRRHRIIRSPRHVNAHCRRNDPHPMYRRCRWVFGPRSHCTPWSTVRGDCCQPRAPMGWGECQYPPPFFGPLTYDSAEESNSDPESDNQKQDTNEQTPEASCPFSSCRSWYQGVVRTHNCHDNIRWWKSGPSREKVVTMLSWKQKVPKEKLRRIEAHLERLRPSEDKTKETTTVADAGPKRASSMDTNPRETSAKETSAERGWETIADSE